MHHPVTFTRLGDFTATRRLLILSAIAVALGLAGAVIAVALLDLIALSTNLFFHHRLSIEPARRSRMNSAAGPSSSPF